MRADQEALAVELAETIPDPRMALHIARIAGVRLPERPRGDAIEVWRHVVAAATEGHLLATLLDHAGGYTADRVIAADVVDPGALLADPLSEPEWDLEPDRELYEARVSKHSTLLPVSFLRAGLAASRAVCKISYQKHDELGIGRTIVGTGFLIGPDELLTCYHVLPDAMTAARATVEFNYEHDESGAQVKPEQVRLVPERGFRTSGSLVYDWTVVRTERPVGDAYGFLPLHPVDHHELVFVNIVGHPNGEAKQISLYDNLVERVTPERVLYTTETAGGSSGSPVFDSRWQVVALHNGQKKLYDRRMVRQVMRNAGVNINRIIEQAGTGGRTESG